MYVCYIHITPANARRNDKICHEPLIAISMLISLSLSICIYLYISTKTSRNSINGISKPYTILLDHMPATSFIHKTTHLQAPL